MAAPKITTQTTIGQVLEMFPDAVEVFEKYGLPCAGCLALFMDSIETGARRHEVDADRLVAELNRYVRDKTGQVRLEKGV